MVSPLDVKVELLLSGWIDITSDVRGAPSRGGLNGTRGTASEGQRPSPGSYTMLINNRDGKYSPRNLEGPYYGQLGRNIPIRISVDFPAPELRSVSSGTAGDVESFTVSAPAGLQEGDVLVAFQSFATFPAEEDLRAPAGGSTWWRLERTLEQGILPGVLSVAWWKVALANEPANYTFYSPAGGEGVAAIAAIEGAVFDYPGMFAHTPNNESGITTAVTTPTISTTGLNDFELRWAAGIPVGAGVTWTPPAGVTEQADLNSADAVTATLGTRSLSGMGQTAFLDFTASGNVDDGNGITIAIPSRSYRFHGEVSEWPPRGDCSDGNLWVPLSAVGPLQRLNQGAPPQSSLFNYYQQKLSSISNVIWAYWPLEDGPEVTSGASAIAGYPPLTRSGDVAFGSSDRIFGSRSVAVLQSNARFVGSVPAAAADDVEASVLFSFQDSQPDDNAILLRINTSGSAASWRVIYNTGFIISMSAFDSDGVLLGTTGTFDFSAILELHQRFLLYASVTQAGADVNYSVNITTIDNNYLVTQNGIGDTLLGQTMGTAQSIHIGPGLNNVVVGHAGVGTLSGPVGPTDGAITGYFGEQAAERIRRLLTGTGVGFEVTIGPNEGTIFPFFDETGTVPMGEEPVATAMTKIEEAVESDRGILYESRDRIQLTYVTLNALYHQSPTAPLRYGDLTTPLQATDDDQLLTNDVAVAQSRGGTARAVLESGPLSVATPPLGAGTYGAAASVNVASESQLPQIANWILHVGTWDDQRYEHLEGRNLAILACPTDPILTRYLAALDPGDLITIDDLPLWISYNLAQQLMRGGTEFLDKYQWSIATNTVPAGPYIVGIFSNEGDVPAADEPKRYSSQGSVTAGGLVLSGAAGDYASTPDHASLDITGDIDIRVDATAQNWTPASEQTLLSKYADTGAQRSYRFAINSGGTLRLQWSTDGTTAFSSSTTVVPTIPDTDRIILRVTMDVNDGAGNRVVTFYTAPAGTGDVFTGPWTQIEQFTIAGTTSIFNSSADVEIGARDGGTQAPFAGIIHGAALYDGIAGTLVASPDFPGQTQGAASFVDAQGRTWTIQGNATMLGAFRSGTDTNLLVETLLGPLWTTTPGGSFDIRVDGVRLRVTAIGAATGQFQNFTVEQVPINGAERTIDSGTEVQLWNPARFAL